MVGRIERVALREVWRHEAADLTVWLEENADVLCDALGVSLSGLHREQPAGTLSVDLLGEDADGNLVVIENQLERSDHAHLGQLLTYVTAFDARMAVWIVADPRPEHVRAIAWLNEATAACFYLLKLEAVRIGASDPAPLLTVIAGPSEESREVGETKREMAEDDRTRRRFWEQLLERAAPRTPLHAGAKAGCSNWASAPCGRRGLSFAYIVRQNGAAVDLWSYRTAADPSGENPAAYRALLAHREQIEAAFGQPLEWRGQAGQSTCLIRHDVDCHGWRDETQWPQTQEAMIDAMVRLEQALRPFIDALEA